MKRENDFLSIKEAAKRTGYTERHIRRLAKWGKIKGAYKKGGLWKIPIDSIADPFTENISPVFNLETCEVDSVWFLGIQSACLEYCVTVDDLIDCLVDPGNHPEASNALPRMQEKAISQLKYIGRAIQAVKSLDSGGSMIPDGSRKRSRRQARANLRR